MERSRRLRYIALEGMLVLCALMAMLFGIWVLSSPGRPRYDLLTVAAILFVVFLVGTVRLVIDPDYVRARQTEAVLGLASKTLECLQGGLTVRSAQEICQILLPATKAIAIAITDCENVLGYAGVTQVDSRGGSPIRTAATLATIEDGTTQILLSTEEIGFPAGSKVIKAAIIVPLVVMGERTGTLKFYYRSPRAINETQISVAEGFAELLSTQLASILLESQTKIATKMELRALQSQINPHFLFNTINTIAAFVRTDPDRARVLLREFATFYRRTLENSSDLIELSRELEQVERYFAFEQARFGEDRVSLSVKLEDGLESVRVPAFMIQPLVENAVRHAMPEEGTLHIQVLGRTDGDDVILQVVDDGVGMDAATVEGMSAPRSEGMGIAVENIRNRIRGFYAAGSSMEFDSVKGEGTTVTLFLREGTLQQYDADGEDWPVCELPQR